jgi:hypothetical protein
MENRLTISFTEKFGKLLENTSKIEGVTRAELIRRSVAVYAYILNELSDGRSHLQIVKDDDQTIKELVLFSAPRKNSNNRVGKTKSQRVDSRRGAQNAEVESDVVNATAAA